jgi:hypothetical protein
MDASKDITVCGSHFCIVQNSLFTLEENVIHRHTMPEDPSTESNPHRSGVPTDNPHRHRWEEEAVTHLHTEDNKRKA